MFVELNKFIVLDLFELDFTNSFYTGIGHIVEDTVSEELNNDNDKTEVSNYGFLDARYTLSKYATLSLTIA